MFVEFNVFKKIHKHLHVFSYYYYYYYYLWLYFLTLGCLDLVDSLLLLLAGTIT